MKKRIILIITAFCLFLSIASGTVTATSITNEELHKEIIEKI